MTNNANRYMELVPGYLGEAGDWYRDRFEKMFAWSENLFPGRHLLKGTTKMPFFVTPAKAGVQFFQFKSHRFIEPFHQLQLADRPEKNRGVPNLPTKS